MIKKYIRFRVKCLLREHFRIERERNKQVAHHNKVKLYYFREAEEELERMHYGNKIPFESRVRYLQDALKEMSGLVKELEILGR